MHGQQAGQGAAQLGAGHDVVDKAVVAQVFGGLEIVGQLLAQGLLDHAAAGKGRVLVIGAGKASAAMAQAVVDRAGSRRPPPCDVWLAAVVDEEHAYRGVVALCDGTTAEAAIVAEPTSLRIVTATKGVVRFQVRVDGRAAHSSRPELGTSAVLGAARLALLLDEHHRGLAARRHPLLGTATGSIGTIHGGDKVHISGTRMRGVLEVTFGGIDAAGIKAISDTEIEVTTPVHLPGTVPVAVRTSTGTGSLLNAFTFVGECAGCPAVRPDINSDGKTDATDIQLVVNAVLQFKGYKATFNSDVNGDGKVDALDIQAIVNSALFRD